MPAFIKRSDIMNINQTLNMNTLFSSLPSKSSNGMSKSFTQLSGVISDYTSIKSGSYGKLMKAYYTKYPTSTYTESDTVTSSIKTKIYADSAKEKADALCYEDKKSVFTKTGTAEDGSDEYNMDAIYKSVSSFIESYNTLILDATSSSSSSVQQEASNLTNYTSIYTNLLSNAGITVNDDKTLDIDEEDFKKASISSIKSIFSGAGSFSYQVSLKASMISYYADRESSLTQSYSSSGAYLLTYSSGNIMDEIF